MKLATYDDGSRDGQLVVVSRDLSRALYATHVATRLQQVLDDWNFLAPQLQELARTLEQGKAREAFAFEAARCLAPLPRAPHWSEVQAYRGDAKLPSATNPGAATDVGGEAPAAGAATGDVTHLPGDIGTGPTADVGIDAGVAGWRCAAGLAVITGDVAQGAAPAQALDGVRLLMLVNIWHALVPPTPPAREGRANPRRIMRAGARSAVACSPVVVTPDELGAAWSGGRLGLPVYVEQDGRALPAVALDTQMALHAGQLIACLTRGRELRAGSVISAGGFGWADGSAGLAVVEQVRIEVLDRGGATVFGAIDQTVAVIEPSAPSRGAAAHAEDAQSNPVQAPPAPQTDVN